MEEGLADPVHQLRICIPPFEEIEERLVIPPWPPRRGTLAQRLETDRVYIDLLDTIKGGRLLERDRLHVASEILKYVHNHPEFCANTLDYAHRIYFAAERYIEGAEKLEADDWSSPHLSVEHIRQRVYYYGQKVRRGVAKLLGYE
jgi:hypothetical protein